MGEKESHEGKEMTLTARLWTEASHFGYSENEGIERDDFSVLPSVEITYSKYKVGVC